MNRTIRLAALLRWTTVAMHTALVVSMGIMFATAGDSRIERITNRGQEAIVMLLDLPVTILSIPLFALRVAAFSPHAVAVTAMYILLGGLQWYLIASLLARWTCGFQRTMPVASKRFGIAMLLGLLLVGGCGTIPWGGRLEQALHPRNAGPYAKPAVAFDGVSKDLRHSVVVPTLDTPMPERKNVIWCATFPMAWDRLKNDVIEEPIQVANAEAVAERLNKAMVTDDILPDGSYYAAAGFTKDVGR